jgi:hypothetical protein
MADVKVRGCCCGIPFGFGLLGALAALITFTASAIPEISPGTLLAFGKILAISGLL